jgi:hypothetical protein
LNNLNVVFHLFDPWIDCVCIFVMKSHVGYNGTFRNTTWVDLGSSWYDLVHSIINIFVRPSYKRLHTCVSYVQWVYTCWANMRKNCCIIPIHCFSLLNEIIYKMKYMYKVNVDLHIPSLNFNGVQ